jgi:hypothetical protein
MKNGELPTKEDVVEELIKAIDCAGTSLILAREGEIPLDDEVIEACKLALVAARAYVSFDYPIYKTKFWNPNEKWLTTETE